MEKHILSKSTFIRGVQCLKSLYLNKKRPFLRDRLSDEQRAIFKRGTDVGILAQQLFPGGIDMKPNSPSQYRKKVAETAEIIRTNTFKTIYEAAFQYDQLLILLDILVKDGDGWYACEVKSSLSVSETFLNDAAFQYYVIKHSGIDIKDFYLITMNPDYQRQDKLDLQQLFIRHNVLNEVKKRQQWIEKQVIAEKETLLLAHSPKIDIGPHCNHPYPCDFQNHCWKKVADNSLLYLDAFPEEERFKAYFTGQDSPERIDQKSCNEEQRMQIQAAITKEVYVNHQILEKLLKPVSDKAVSMSLLFVRPAVPFLQNTRPYQHLPLAVLTKEQNNEEIHLFSPDESSIARFISFINSLLATKAPLIIYDAFPLIRFLDESGEQTLLNRLQSQLIDLKSVFEKNAVFHYRLKGDYSLHQVSMVLFNQYIRELNPALLTMEWQKALFNKSENLEPLLESTRNYLTLSNAFMSNFLSYLQHAAYSD